MSKEALIATVNLCDNARPRLSCKIKRSSKLSTLGEMVAASLERGISVRFSTGMGLSNFSLIEIPLFLISPKNKIEANSNIEMLSQMHGDTVVHNKPLKT